MMIELKKITWDNWRECMNLEIRADQKNFIASNQYSLAQSYVALLNDEWPPRTYAIYDDDILLGFTMFCYYTAEKNEYGDEPCYFIYRFMIDKKYQNKGFGRKALIKILENIKTFPQGRVESIYLSYEPSNTVARNLYQSLGFVETGQYAYDELVAKLVL